MADYWFKPKTYGYGAYPLDWRGWAAIAVFCVAVTAWSLLALLGGLEPLPATIVMWLGVTAMVVVFVIWAKKKSNGPWRWRWGKRGEKA